VFFENYKLNESLLKIAKSLRTIINGRTCLPHARSMTIWLARTSTRSMCNLRTPLG